MKLRTILIFIIGLALLIAAVFFASDDILSPYVPFKEAKTSAGKYVQIIGTLDKSVPVTHREGEYTFTAIDREGTRLRVLHRGTKPQNFEHTDQVVMLGKYRTDGDVFEADKVLVKCPSKYRRQE
ncbi:MAG TPA: cytochrome c maturation protein CcmE [Spirochaetota bacterium]|nr:cytochrome c maturation protein CcmE [Spirochaetota bacterium]HPC39349.1 cytochrome c maturation protein CcmE [Spirochaetota bacterium]HPL15156.1 cytochrome c maturation protein CcmE [Spirochaetota bacterium]HQF08713.1 cytochrome c maturation protein CcmE [Spirochaetota bacterium]HQH97586.1 cytochrome c maturation protein CcmE [Spirochaetota bacterium]